MRLMFGLVLLVGIALAGGAVYLAKGQMAQYQAANARAQEALGQIVPTKTVFVAKEQLTYGKELTEEDVREVNWPENAIPEGAFTDKEVLFPDEEKPRLVLRTMEKDEALLAIKVTEPGQDAGPTSRLERGKRAFTIKVDKSSGIAGFLRDDDRVDIYWTGRVASSPNGGDVTKLIEAGANVIAIDRNESTNVARTVTVAVSPPQVAALALAQSTGDLTLSLVGTEDDTVAETVEVNQNSLLGIVEKEVVEEVVEEEEICTVRKRSGAEVITVEIPCPD